MIKWFKTTERLPHEYDYTKTPRNPQKILVVLHEEYVHEAYFGENSFNVGDDYYDIEDGDITHWAELNMPQKD